MKNLKHQVALVTGAGSSNGIGFATAKLIGKGGSAVILVSTTDRIHTRVAELKKLGLVARGYVGNLTDPGFVESLIRDIQISFGRLDICINNAGMTVIGEKQFESAVDDITLEDWLLSIERNLTTCFLITKAALPLMRAQKYGRIINITSTSGPVQAFTGDAAYHAAKAGMWGYTRACALETASDGITVNAVAPGWIATDSQLDSESKAGLLSPMKRSGTPEEVAFAIRFLADPRSSYITGQLLIVDGGNSVPEDRSWVP